MCISEEQFIAENFSVSQSLMFFIFSEVLFSDVTCVFHGFMVIHTVHVFASSAVGC